MSPSLRSVGPIHLRFERMNAVEVAKTAAGVVRSFDIRRFQLDTYTTANRDIWLKPQAKINGLAHAESRSGRFSELRLCGSVLGSISTMIYHPGRGKEAFPVVRKRRGFMIKREVLTGEGWNRLRLDD